MNKKEINEIKGLYKDIENCGITRIAGCYVNGDKDKICTFNEIFLNLPEEEIYKYLTIFKKTLSGVPGRNLLNMEFSAKDLSASDGRKMLLALKGSGLRTDDVLDQFYDEVIRTYGYVGNYLILVIYQSYDVPGMTTDGIMEEDASEEVYSYILCSICPVTLSKPGLGYMEDEKEFHTLKQFFCVGMPDTGFLFPAFNERSSDDTGLLYFTRKADTLQRTLIEDLLQCRIPLSASKQREGFSDLVSDVLGEESDFDTLRNIHDNLQAFVDQKEEDAENGNAEDDGPVALDSRDVKNILEKSGVKQERLEDFDTRYQEYFGKNVDMETGEILDTEAEGSGNSGESEENNTESPRNSTENPEDNESEKIVAANLMPTRIFEVKTADVVVRINSDRTDLLQTRVIDGKKCLVIEMGDGILVNGVPVRS